MVTLPMKVKRLQSKYDGLEAIVKSILDLKAKYWQIPTHRNSKELTVFCTSNGSTYEFWVMPFGLKNTPEMFQKMMNDVLARYIREFVLVYLDNFIIFSRNWNGHLRHLGIVLERLRQKKNCCASSKCQIALPTLQFLGHKVTATANKSKTFYLDQL